MKENNKLTEEKNETEQSLENEELQNVILEEDDGEPTKFNIPWKGLIFIGVVLTLMIVCIIVIGVNGGFAING